MDNKIKKHISLFCLLAAMAVFLDQWTKIYCFAGSDSTLFKYALGHLRFEIVQVYNTGAVFGIGKDGNPFFAILSAIFLVIMIPFFILHYIPSKATTLGVIASGITYGGVIGNFIDRIWVLKVRDFILLGWDDYIWPIFNVADICICAGVCYFAFIIIFEPGESGKKKDEKTSSDSKSPMEIS